MRIPSASTDRTLSFVAVDITDLKTRKTGLTTFTVYRSRNGGTATAYTTPTVAELSSANMPGVYTLLLDEDTTLTAGRDAEEYVVHITQANMAPVTRSIDIYRVKATEGQSMTAANSAMNANVTYLLGTAWLTPGVAGTPDVNTKLIGAQTASASGTVTFPNATLASTTNITAGVITTATTATNVTTVNGLAAGVITAASIAADAITDAKVASDVTIASVTGSVGSVTGAVGSVTGAVGSVTGNVGGNVAGSVGSVTGNVGGNVTGSVGSVSGSTAQTGDTYALANGVNGFIAIKTDTAAILVDTTEIGVAGAGLTNINLPNQTMDIVGNITGNLSGSVGSVTATVTVGAINAAGLSDLFDTNSGTTYASAVAGSVVKEIADNAGGASLTTDDICEAMFTYNATATYGTSDAGSVVAQIANNAGGGTPPTADEIADAVFNEPLSGHTTPGTAGAALRTSSTVVKNSPKAPGVI